MFSEIRFLRSSDRPVSGSQAQRRAGRCQDECFGQKLADQSAGRRAQGGAHGDLSRAAFGADQLQAGDVHAGDQQQQRRAAQQHQQDGTNVADNSFGQRRDVGALAPIGVGIFLLQLCGDGSDVGQGGLQGDAVLEARHAVHAVAAAALVAFIGRLIG
jgi:hypothetical protein